MTKIKITKIFWKRTYLFIEYVSDSPITLSMIQYNRNSKKNIIHNLETKKMDNNTYRSKINITIAEGREILKNGEWEFIVNNDSNDAIDLSDEVISGIEDLSRVFRYLENFYAYVVSFFVYEDQSGTIKLKLFSNYMKTLKKPWKKNMATVSESANGLVNKIKSISFLLFQRVLNLQYQLVRLFAFKKANSILFMSENRTKIMDNLLAIDKRMKEREIDKTYKIRYSFRNIFDNNKDIISWLRVVSKIAKSNYIFVDDYAPIFAYINLSKKTVLTQVWHAGFGFKLVGYGRFGISGSPHPFISCHRKYTYGLIGNDYLKEIYSEVWGIEKDALLPTGMPRLEHFLDKNIISEKRDYFYAKYPNFKGKKIINFALTYRGTSQKDAYYDYSKIDFKALYDFCKNNNYLVLFGKHHFIKQEIPIPEEYRNLIIDMSEYSLNDTYYITDILITDYSSSFYDFLLLKKPVLFYVYDAKLYAATRGIHRPLEKVAPGKLCYNFNEIITALKNKDYGNNNISDLLVDNCIKNKTIASDKVIDYIVLKKNYTDVFEGENNE